MLHVLPTLSGKRAHFILDRFFIFHCAVLCREEREEWCIMLHKHCGLQETELDWGREGSVSFHPSIHPSISRSDNIRAELRGSVQLISENSLQIVLHRLWSHRSMALDCHSWSIHCAHLHAYMQSFSSPPYHILSYHVMPFSFIVFFCLMSASSYFFVLFYLPLLRRWYSQTAVCPVHQPHLLISYMHYPLFIMPASSAVEQDLLYPLASHVISSHLISCDVMWCHSV